MFNGHREEQEQLTESNNHNEFHNQQIGFITHGGSKQIVEMMKAQAQQQMRFYGGIPQTQIMMGGWPGSVEHNNSWKNQQVQPNHQHHHVQQLQTLNFSLSSESGEEKSSSRYEDDENLMDIEFVKPVQFQKQKQMPNTGILRSREEDEDDDDMLSLNLNPLARKKSSDSLSTKKASTSSGSIGSPTSSPESCVVQKGELELQLKLDTANEAHGLQLVHVLLKCAEAVANEEIEVAVALLGQLKKGASVYGDSMQRLAAHFSEGLAARILKNSSRFGNNLADLDMGDILRDFEMRKGCILRGESEQDDDFLSAFTAMYRVSPFFKFAHFTANQALLEAFEGKDLVHVIDIDIQQGFQWPSFIQSLASRPGGPPSFLRLTGMGNDGKILRETGARLASFAETFRVGFEFSPIVVSDVSFIDATKLGLRSGETIAVNSVLHLHRLNASTAKLDVFLRTLASIRPKIVTLVEQEAAHNTSSFLSRFMEALHYYAAVFDSLDASLPQRNEERVRIEQVLFSKQIRNIVSCEGLERIERHEKMDFWASKMCGSGFRQIPLSSHAVSQAKLLLQLCPCDGYRLAESSSMSSFSSSNSFLSDLSAASLSLGWQDRLLITASSWAF